MKNRAYNWKPLYLTAYRNYSENLVVPTIHKTDGNSYFTLAPNFVPIPLLAIKSRKLLRVCNIISISKM